MFGAMVEEDQGSGRVFTTQVQHEAFVTDATEWSNAYATSGSDTMRAPPSLTAVKADGPTWQDWFGMGKQTVTGLVDIFGRVVNPQTGQPLPQPAPSQGMPLWGIVALGIGGVVVLGVAARALRGGHSYAGYKRRKHRKHRR